jgi:hypothetical protein
MYNKLTEVKSREGYTGKGSFQGINLKVDRVLSCHSSRRRATMYIRRGLSVHVMNVEREKGVREQDGKSGAGF